MSAGVPDVLNFLADYSFGKSYRTVNVARSMLSSTLSLNLGNHTKDPMVVNLLKGIYNAGYVSTWNPNIVLSFWMQLLMSIFLCKAVTLVALVGFN